MDFMAMLTSLMPEEFILEQLEKRLQIYKQNKNPEARYELEAMCVMFVGKEIINRQGVEKFSKELEQVESIKNRLNQTS